MSPSFLPTELATFFSDFVILFCISSTSIPYVVFFIESTELREQHIPEKMEMTKNTLHPKHYQPESVGTLLKISPQGISWSPIEQLLSIALSMPGSGRHGKVYSHKVRKSSG